MNSSTSGSRTERKVISLVVFLLLSCELALLRMERSISGDISHILAIPKISKSLAEGEGLQILFLGNSLTRTDIDLGVFQAVLRKRNASPFSAELVFPDGTTIIEWYYLFKHYFVNEARSPNILIVPFARTDVQDLPIRGHQPGRLGRYYVSLRDVPEVFTEDLREFGGRVEFLLGSVSTGFASKHRVKRRVFDALVPHYRDSVGRIVGSLRDTQSKEVRESRPTYRRLERLINIAESQGTHLVLVAMPLPRVYPIDSRLERILENSGVTFIDSRFVEGISVDRYPDGEHLDKIGAVTYSRFLARQLSDRFALTLEKDTITAGSMNQANRILGACCPQPLGHFHTSHAYRRVYAFRQ